MISSRMRCLHCFLALVLVVSAAGCTAPLLFIGAGAVGGYAVSGDTFEGITAKSQEEIWDAAYRVASIMGTIEEDNRRSGQMTARINGARVTITLVPVNLTSTTLRIKARKGIFPRRGTAQEVYVKINTQLEE
ncbi:MAG: hypothetical protein Q7K71_06405 [Candidatus Omnitrophota bacterium]|nr:hypothetical protein [Candidatus Omnitrophota bacterium]